MSFALPHHRHHHLETMLNNIAATAKLKIARKLRGARRNEPNDVVKKMKRELEKEHNAGRRMGRSGWNARCRKGY